MSEEDNKDVPKKRKMAGGIKIDHSLLNASRPKRVRRSVKEAREEDDCVPWNTHEKEKLLEALYRHSHLAFESISHVVKTKSPKQVEHFIEKMLNSSSLIYEKRIVEVDPEKGAAPLELWLSLVQELVISNKKVDHSQHYTKIMSMIGKNEPMPEKSGFPDLDWRNLYQFVSDLLADKATLQPLTNMESLVILDMMHSMGDTLHMSDTRQQRKLLDLKYQLFKWQVQHVKDDEFTATYSAINNDYSKVRYDEKNPEASTSSTNENDESITLVIPQQPSSSSSSSATTASALSSSSASTSWSQSQPSTSSQSHSNSNLQLSSPPRQSTETETHIHPSSSFPSSTTTTTTSTDNITSTKSLNKTNSNYKVLTYQNRVQDTATTTQSVQEQSNSSQNLSNTPASSSFPQSSLTLDSNTNTTNQHPSNTSHSTTHSSVYRDEEIHDDGEEEEDDDDNDNNYGKREDEFTDPVPKLFSLNPLTIPPNLLNLHPKSTSGENDVPVIIK